MKIVVQKDMQQIEEELKYETFVAECVFVLLHVKYYMGTTLMSHCGCISYDMKRLQSDLQAVSLH